MSSEIVKEDFMGEDIPLTDKLNALYFIVDEAYRLSVENYNLVDDSFIDTIHTARDWFSTFLDAFEKIDGDTYDFLESQTCEIKNTT